jgi:hypothetical protein
LTFPSIYPGLPQLRKQRNTSGNWAAQQCPALSVTIVIGVIGFLLVIKTLIKVSLHVLYRVECSTHFIFFLPNKLFSQTSQKGTVNSPGYSASKPRSLNIDQNQISLPL